MKASSRSNYLVIYYANNTNNIKAIPGVIQRI